VRVLVGCETSGAVRDAFERRGHQATSCDLLPSKAPGRHYQGDIFDLLKPRYKWDLFIAHPPCTRLSSSGYHWNDRGRGHEGTEEALQFVRDLISLSRHIRGFCLENPVGLIGTRLMPATQIIQPNQFGEDASKATCLWLRNLPALRPTVFKPGRLVSVPGTTRRVMRWANQTDSGQNHLLPTDDRWDLRSATLPGVAEAMGAQWGGSELQPHKASLWE